MGITEQNIAISTLKQQFVHPLLAYNFLIDGIPGTMSVHCKATSLPEVSHDKIPVKFRGRELYYNGAIAKFADWTTTIREDIYYRARTSLENWCNLIANRTNNYGLITPLIQRSLFIYMLAPGVNIPIAQYELINAFPYKIGPITVDQDSNDQVVSYEVTWSIDAWVRTDITVSGLINQSDATTDERING